MSTQYPRSSGRRSGRGPRRNRERGESRRESSPSPAPTPQKKGLIQRVIAFFTGGKSPSKNGHSKTYVPRSASSGTSTREQSAAPVTYRQARKPEAVEVTSEKLYVGNLSFDATESDLSELFNGVGAVKSAEIVTHKQTEKSKGFGFVTMTSLDEAKRAVEVLHDKEFMGRKLVVSGAKTPVDRS